MSLSAWTVSKWGCFQVSGYDSYATLAVTNFKFKQNKPLEIRAIMFPHNSRTWKDMQCVQAAREHAQVIQSGINIIINNGYFVIDMVVIIK